MPFQEWLNLRFGKTPDERILCYLCRVSDLPRFEHFALRDYLLKARSSDSLAGVRFAIQALSQEPAMYVCMLYMYMYA